ncbi:MAG: hypothetical protein DLM57_12490 [Pseudonocardiales bacterium]|nr:MAG: hypothetical protein DLM57_12490 [Pseudonocardiales bacterium]
MDGMSSEQAFRARELSASGIWSGRIAELLDVDETLVLRALAGDTFTDVAAPLVVEAAPSEPEAPEPVDPNAWPPPVDDSTEWATVRISRGYGLGVDEVSVRWVMLWGQRVRINAAAEVWCHFCLTFKTTKALSHPHNGCPVGLPFRGGIVAYDPDDVMPEEPRYPPVGGGYVDLLRASW